LSILSYRNSTLFYVQLALLNELIEIDLTLEVLLHFKLSSQAIQTVGKA